MSIEKFQVNAIKGKERPEEQPIEGIFPKPDVFICEMEKFGFLEHIETYKKVLRISELIKKNGGMALLVGGSVRDMLWTDKIIPKDFDLELYGLEAIEVEKIVREVGNVSDVGKAFGILKISLGNGLDIDISLPRVDSKIGVGHRGFEVKTDPNMSIPEACKRRDFTMNSVAANPLTGELFDPFNGVKDIRNKILRITDPERFRDDPLRVLRGIQFVGRFGLEIDKDTMSILQEMVPCIKELPKERIGEEWKKLLLKSPMPSVSLIAGMILGVFK